jgi:peptide/nickel transport system substrate-binding protein
VAGGTALAQGGPVTFTFAHPGPIRTMDAPVTWFGSTHWLTNTMYDCLIWRAADGDGYVGQSAESWSAIDELTWRFVLREGLTFHNGEPLDAEAVKWNIDRTRTRTDFLVQPQWTFVNDVIVIDERTLDITTHEPMAYFEFDVSYNGCQILPPRYMEEVGEEEFARNPVGSGPYRLVEFTASDRYVFEAWDGYWAGRPEVDRIVYQVIPEQSSQIAALLAGQIDFVRAIPPVEQARLANASGIELLRGPASIQHILYVRYQTETGVLAQNYPGFEPITADVRIRQAISHAIDRELLAEVQGSARPSLLRTDEFNPEHRGQYAGEAAAIAHYDPERARALIIEAGYDPAGGNRPVLHLDAPDFQQGNEKEVAEVMAAMLEDAGFDVELNILALSAFQEQIFNPGNFRGIALTSVGGNPSLVPQFYTCDWRNPNALPCVLDETRAWDELSRTIRATVDADARLDLWTEFWDLYVEKAGEITLHHLDSTMAINSRFEWTPRADGWMTFRDLRLR